MQENVLPSLPKSRLWQLSHNEVTWYNDFFQRCIFQGGAGRWDGGNRWGGRQVKQHILKITWIQSNLTLTRTSALTTLTTSPSPISQYLPYSVLYIPRLFWSRIGAVSDLCILPHEKYLANIFNNFLPNRVSVRVSQKDKNGRRYRNITTWKIFK